MFPAIVQLSKVAVSCPKVNKPPPWLAELPAIVSSMSVTVFWLRRPLPSPTTAVVVLPEMVVPVIVSWPLLRIPPPARPCWRSRCYRRLSWFHR